MIYLEKTLNSLNSLPDSLIYFFLGLSAFVENILPPVPGDTITAFGAFLVGTGKLSFIGVYISTTLGSLLGFMALLYIGRYLGRRFFIERDYRFLKAQSIIKAEAWFEKYGYYLVALNRFLPGVRSAIAVVGGIMRLKMLRAGSLALISCSIWNLIWITAGYNLGTNWEVVTARISGMMRKYNIGIIIIFVIFIVFILLRRKFRTRIPRKEG